MIRIMPAEGLKIRDPVTHLFIDPVDGLDVDENDLYWSRRLRDGDVIPAESVEGLHARSAKSAKNAAGQTGGGES
jgi:Protein of unknown function (DUF2635)